MNVEPAAPVVDSATPSVTEPVARPLSLQELGVGPDGRESLLAPPLGPSEAVSVENRLQSSLLTALATADRARGVGLDVPVRRAVTELVLNSDLPLATSASLLVVTDSSGLTRAVSVLESSGAAHEWQRIADELKRVLSAHKLRIPARSAGVSFQLLVSSRALLASGSQPKLETEVFGKAKRGLGTPPAGRISLLPREPALARAQFPRLEGSHPQPWSGFATNIGSASADLSDMNAQSRRIVATEMAQLDIRWPTDACSGGAASAGATSDCTSATQ